MTHSTESAQRRVLEEALASIKELAEGLTVTDIQEVEHAKRLENLREAPAEACRTCPWRRENEGSEDRHLRDENVVNMWNKLRDGTALACHKTVAREAVLTEEDRACGWTVPPDSVTPRECAGALSQLLKEEKLRVELGSYRAYFDVRGTRAMTPQAFERLGLRRLGGPDVIPVREPKNPDLYGRSWIPEPNGADTLPVVPPCFCPVCQRHDEVHAQAEVTPPGASEPVSVDAALAPLMEALWRVGAVTFASCENLRYAVTRIAPSELHRLVSEVEPRGFTYAHTVTHGLAFVRGLNSPAWEPIAAEVERLTNGQVTRLGPGIHVAFPLAEVPRLVEAL